MTFKVLHFKCVRLIYFAFNKPSPDESENRLRCVTKRPHLSVVSLLKSGSCMSHRVSALLFSHCVSAAEKRDYEGFFSSCQVGSFSIPPELHHPAAPGSPQPAAPAIRDIRVIPNLTNCRARNISTLLSSLQLDLKQPSSQSLTALSLRSRCLLTSGFTLMLTTTEPEILTHF